jgi:para-aminobenzoate synthetase component 1
MAERSDGVAPLVEELPPSLSPWETVRRLDRLPHLLFLDSAAVGPPLGRFSYVCADPFATLRARGPIVTWTDGGGLRSETDNPFTVLARRLSAFRGSRRPDLPPFQGGAAGLFGYDLRQHLERLAPAAVDEFRTPDLAVGFYDWVIAFDHGAGRGWLISTGLPETEAAVRKERAVRRAEQVRQRLAIPSGPLPDQALRTLVEPALSYPVSNLVGVLSNFDRSGYLDAVRRVIEYIRAGDCFQVNLSQRLLTAATLPPLELYRRLRERNPAPFAAFFDLGDFALVSASPERFLKVTDGFVETRPIKGTRPRSDTPDADAALRRELLASAKDRAENVMIVDLLRNDLGRVCAYGSVEVAALCRLESHPTVHHLVSEVHGRLRPEMGPIDLLRAAFPGGSVTGAPKVRAMQIINELEPTARGPYCGSLAWIGFDGAMDSSILIRTFTLGRGWTQFPVGGGIVADSDPEAEYAETLHKAEGLLRALR